MQLTLTRAELEDYLFETHGVSRTVAKQLVDTTFEALANALIRGEEVKISGFGNFKVRDKSARPGRNPRTGEEVNVSARRVVTFRAGETLKARLQGKLIEKT